jgi:hypothetical protein
MNTIAIMLADYEALRANRQRLIVRQRRNQPVEYYVGFGQFSTDRDAAIRYDAHEVAGRRDTVLA